MVTMDRLKIMEVEADYRTWKEYALERHLHSAVLNFLDLKKDDFYEIETTVKGKNYITARGWEDLSRLIQVYEEMGKKSGPGDDRPSISSIRRSPRIFAN